MKAKGEEELTSIYQKLVEIEYEKLEKFNFNFNDPQTFLTINDVSTVNPNINISELVLKGLLIRFQENLYRTSHFDLIYRLVQIRNLEYQHPLPLEFKVVLKKELVPDFGRYEINKFLPEIVKSPYKNLIIKCLITSLHRVGYKGLSSYQFLIVKELLSGFYKNVAIVAPTASGKTLTFFIPLLAKAIEKVADNKTGITCLLIYPRKALERDQLQSLLRLVDIINMELRSDGKDMITIGIDDSDTPREGEVEDGESFRKLRCVNCEGELIIKLLKGKSLVVCRNCQKEYPYIIPTKDEIWRIKPMLLITNMWIVYRRLLSSRSVNLFKDVSFIVVDEAHVYTHFLGGHISYILRILRFVASQHGDTPVFVFSSATIPNPTEFIAALAGIDKNELFYIDFQTTLEEARGEKLTRILLYLYLLPHPSKDIETLTEAIILAATLWCHKNNMKGITFIDSISEINTMINYIHATILGIREGREVTDHLFKTEPSPNNDYCWITLAPERSFGNLSLFKDFILSRYKQSIGMHYGGLSLEKRAEVESSFIRGEKRMLLSTSTLELGIDLSDVAVILQHKLPLTPEGVVQRVGRAGRNPSCYRIALGIVVLPTLPLSTLYMFDERLRETLENVSFLPPLRIGEVSHNIRLQHTLSLLLLKRALENKATHIDIDIEGIKTDQDVINCLREIQVDLKDLFDFNKRIGLFEEEILKDSIHKLTELIAPFLKGLNKIQMRTTYRGKYKYIDTIRVEIEKGLNQAREIEKIANELNNIISPIDIIPSEIKKQPNQLIESIILILSKLRELQSLIRVAMESKERYQIDEWLRENLDDFREVINRLSTIFEPPKIFNKIYETISKVEISVFQKKYHINPNDIMNDIMYTLAKLGKHLGNKEEGFIKLLNEVSSKLEQFESIDFEVLAAEEALRRVRNEIKLVPGGKLDLFQVLNLILEGKVHFSLLLETPSPILELIGVEEA
jgi:superfamily II DNA/RNA helicase